MDILIGLLTLLVILLALVGLIAWFGKRISKKLNVNQKNGWLIAHVVFVIIYFGGLLGTLLLAVSTTFTTESNLIYAAHLFIQYFDWFLIIPGAFGSLITGVWLAVRTHWGLTKYYWIIVKWVGNVSAIVYGGNFMRMWIHDNFSMIFSSNMHPLQNPVYLENRQLLFFGTAISFSILLFLLIISYFKPWGKRKMIQDDNS